MKKLLSVALVVVLGLVSVSAMACPKGEELTGGTGKHHKGGTCTPKDAAPADKAAAKK